MNQEICISRIVLGETIRAKMTLLDNGINVLVTGGSLTHVGSVSVAQPAEEGVGLCREIKLVNIVLPGHHDHKISDRFACILSQTLNRTTVVECGVHYDNLSHSGIASVLSASEEILQDLITALQDIGKSAGDA